MSLNATLGSLFDWHGRVGRWSFLKLWLVGLLIAVVYAAPLLVFFGFVFYYGFDYGPEAAVMMMLDENLELSIPALVGILLWNWLWAVILMGALLAQIMATVKRLTDMGWSKWLILLGTVPLINILFWLLLVLVPGRNRIPEQS